MNKLNKLLKMEDKQIQEWLRNIHINSDFNTLSIALLSTNEEIKDCIFRNMSSPAKDAIIINIEKMKEKNMSESEIQKSINIIFELI